MEWGENNVLWVKDAIKLPCGRGPKNVFLLPHPWRDSMLKTCAPLVEMEMQSLNQPPQGCSSERMWSLPYPWECTGGTGKELPWSKRCPHWGKEGFVKDRLASMAICRARTATHKTRIELTAQVILSRWRWENSFDHIKRQMENGLTLLEMGMKLGEK